MRFNSKLISLVMVSLLLTNCATTSRHQVDPLTQSSIENWAFTGKIAVQYPSKHCREDRECKPSSDQGGIRWTQVGDKFDIVISDPFGKTLSTINGDSQQATIKDSEGMHVVEPNEMIARVLHFPVPFSVIKQWVTGRADKNDKAIVTAEGFTQRTVTVEPVLWRNVGQLGKMPSKVTMKSGKNLLRLVVKKWSVPKI